MGKMRKVKVAFEREEVETIYRNENYVLVSIRDVFKIYERGANYTFTEIKVDNIEEFHLKKILSQFGFELVQGYLPMNDEINFLNYFKGFNVGIIKTTKGNNLFVGILEENYTKEFLEEKYKIIINF